MSRIEETLKKIAGDMSRGSSQTSSNTDPQERRSSYPGDPNCPVCGGVGYIRQDLPVDHPDFGRLMTCECLQRSERQGERSRLMRVSNLAAYREKTFENFNLQGRMGLADDQLSSLQTAFNMAQLYSRQLNGWLLLMGGYGTGKTHLAASVANFAVSMGVESLFLTVPDLLDWLRAAYGSADATFESRLEEIRAIRLLILDDLGTQNTTPWAAEKLFQVINFRYVNRLPTVITTNQNLDDIDGRISSRLVDPELVTKVKIIAPDFRMPVNSEGRTTRTDLTVLRQCTFGSFNMRELEGLPREEQESLANAFRLAQAYAENPRGWLVFTGGYFCGKTHLAAAIGNYQAGRGKPVSFWVVSELLDHLRATFSPTSTTTYDRLFEEIKVAPVLILDDFGGQNSSPWAQEKMYQIFSYRYNAELATVITTLLPLEGIEPRLRSRMLDRNRCRVAAITVPAYIPPGGRSDAKGRGRRPVRPS